MKKVKIGIINYSNNPLPEYKKEGDSGMDIMANETKIIHTNETKIIHTNLFVEIPNGWELQVRSRSGLAAKHGIFVLNEPGTIDSAYRGEIMIILHNVGKDDFTVEKGDRIAQLVLQKVPKIKWEVVADLSETERGEGGIGHTGVK